MTFDDLNLHPDILKALEDASYEAPTPIQLSAIPEIIAGSDLRASAQTGTGKTAAFLLPLLNRLVNTKKPKPKRPKILILVPTRELGVQIATQAEKYSKYLRQLKTVFIGGGVSYHIQMRKLSKPYDLLIATPGRLIDYLDRGKIDLSEIEVLVLDEADRMLDMGFIGPVEEIISNMPKSRQTLLFSATLRGEVLKLSKRLMDEPVEIVIHEKHQKNENIKQEILFVDDLNHKNRLLDHILSKDSVKHTIVFTSTKRHADKLANELQDKGHLSSALHGDMSQRQRLRAITQLRKGKINILVATDVAARGIDVSSISHVINFDLPRNIEDYVHRIGRTGRAGSKGLALSFVGGRDAFLVKKIEKYTGQPIECVQIKGFEPRKKPDFSKENPPKKRPRSKRKPVKRFRNKRR